MGLSYSAPSVDGGYTAADRLVASNTLDQTSEIDEAATLGLLGTGNSLAYRVHEAERHMHFYERWYGAAAVPNAPAHVADRIGTATTAFQADAGNNTWGAWLQVLGTTDMTVADGAYFDPHRAMITAVERANAIHFVQVGAGASGAAALLAGTYSEFVFKPTGAASQETPVFIQSRRVAVGVPAWVRVWAVGENTGTVDFFYGAHFYEG